MFVAFDQHASLNAVQKSSCLQHSTLWKDYLQQQQRKRAALMNLCQMICIPMLHHFIPLWKSNWIVMLVSSALPK